MKSSHAGIYMRFFKRQIDLVLSLVAIVILIPVFIGVALLVRIKLGKPVIFKQKRPGLHEGIFTMFKFRTMTDKRNQRGELLPDSERLTKFGKFLRSTSLDELPELFNILMGHMSIVGPRPQLPIDMIFMTPEQRRRHTVLPGLTGLSQVNGRNGLTWGKKLLYDIEYVENITFLGDWKIIIMTISKVFRRDGINTEGMDTAEDLGDYLLRKKKITKEIYSLIIEENKHLLAR